MIDFSEAATEKRRGRPPILSEQKRKEYENSFYFGPRSATNMFYVNGGTSIALEVFGEKGVLLEFNIGSLLYPSKKSIRHKGILEQVGRMWMQNGYDLDTCKKALIHALNLRNAEGWTAKEVERWLRHGRNTGELFTDG